MLKEFISLFTEEFPEGKIWRKGNKYFLVDEIPHNQPQHVGIYLGYVGKVFKPSLWLLQWLKSRTKKKIQVDKKGEWMFTCGKDVFKRSVEKKKRIEKNDTIIVVNRHGECLGYGIFQDRKKVTVRNIFDIGDFLRREKSFKKL